MIIQRELEDAIANRLDPGSEITELERCTDGWDAAFLPVGDVFDDRAADFHRGWPAVT